MPQRAAFDSLDAQNVRRYPTQKNDPVDDVLGDILALDPIARNHSRRLAHEQIALAACAILTAKAKTGVLPAQLPGSFTDPFSGKQLIYKRTAGGFTIYSVCPNGDFESVIGPGHYDESVFTYPAPSPMPVPQDLLGAGP
jgi:hypothetical protein